MAQTTQSTPQIVPVEGRVHISFDDAEIASSTKAQRLERSGMDSQIFVPLDDVHPGILEASDTKRTDAGPGEAHFYTIKTLTANGADEAWYYPYAEGDYAPIRDMLTFGGNRISVRVSQV
ncbi:uncharacterized protein (DUF427 family) [Devosia subaequoris]|uniref:Uncharacterized protein (DUF427 family) n=1 Tax=Devosia subaequoris TaxID=395930 RepID=A0A7W6IQ84_9HYPH|nr:DUF427 domain-containing protein [Devosia subaequoris]MBB4053181.1 uncharacterized protein (DUF427 family) [Devosia subaequoris]